MVRKVSIAIQYYTGDEMKQEKAASPLARAAHDTICLCNASRRTGLAHTPCSALQDPFQAGFRCKRQHRIGSERPERLLHISISANVDICSSALPSPPCPSVLGIQCRGNVCNADQGTLSTCSRQYPRSHDLMPSSDPLQRLAPSHHPPKDPL